MDCPKVEKETETASERMTMNNLEIDRLLQQAEELEGEIASLEYDGLPTHQQQARLNQIRAKLLHLTGSCETPLYKVK